MSREQRIFHGRYGFTILAVFLSLFSTSSGTAEERVEMDDGAVSMELADGWSETDLNAGDVIAGFATQDNRNSMFLTHFEAGGSMTDIMLGTVENFEERFEITREEKEKTGQVNGPGEKKWPAVFKSFEAEMKREEKIFPLKFYLLVFDTSEGLYLIQASTTLPVRQSRERQILEMIRSVVANP
ncbi:MAG: hypothetical protein AAF357_19195 [Verrucomicrobiota bacterium]